MVHLLAILLCSLLPSIVVAAPTGSFTLSCPTSNGTTYNAANGKDYLVQCYLDHAGNDIESGVTASLDACLETCSTTSGCAAVSWVPGSNTCYTHSLSSQSGVTAQNVWGAILTSGPISSSTATPSSVASPTSSPVLCPAINNTIITANGQYYTVECYVDHPGNDIKSITSSSIGACVTACSTTNGCVAVSYVPGGSVCYMHSAVQPGIYKQDVWGAILNKPTTSGSSSTSSSSSPRTPTPNPPITNNPTCPSSNGTSYTASGGVMLNIECNIDHAGGDLGSASASSFAACLTLCSTTPACIAASYVPGSSVCYMHNILTAGSSNAAVWGAVRSTGSTSSFSSSSATSTSPSTSPTAPPSGAWDVIVVGAGPAGIIIADRMSQAGKRTLLIEGGGPSYAVTGGTQRPAWFSSTNLSRVDVPGLYVSIFSEPSSLLCSGTVNAYQACTIGGNTAINAGLFFQPPASDFDLYFPAGWKSADMASAISKLNARQPSTDLPSQDGKRYLQSGYNVAKSWLVGNAGYTEVGINTNANNKVKVFGHPVFDYANGQRGGPVVTYLQTSLARSNFAFWSGVRVTRVLRTGNTATGVLAMINGVNTTIPLATGGRGILSGGALQSPQMLMYSGIGDPATLSRLSAAGILGNLASPSTWINSTAVGAGLFDNPNTFIELSSPSIASYDYSYASPLSGDRDLYLSNRSGPYSFAGVVSSFWDTVVHADGTLAGMQGTIGSGGYADYTSNGTVTLNIYGTSGLASSGKVVLDNNFIPGPNGNVYYSNPRDAFDIATFIARLFAALPGTGLTPLNIAANATVAQIQKYITTYSSYAVGQVNHWSSSCRLGSCVDTNTVVVGMKNLHVVDASILMPLTVNPQMEVMIAAERAAELILAL